MSQLVGRVGEETLSKWRKQYKCGKNTFFVSFYLIYFFKKKKEDSENLLSKIILGDYIAACHFINDKRRFLNYIIFIIIKEIVIK